MATFDFIESDELRVSLERDFEELITCMKAGAWKAAQVIAGSLIQATLADHLIASARTTEDEACGCRYRTFSKSAARRQCCPNAPSNWRASSGPTPTS